MRRLRRLQVSINSVDGWPGKLEFASGEVTKDFFFCFGCLDTIKDQLSAQVSRTNAPATVRSERDRLYWRSAME